MSQNKNKIDETQKLQEETVEVINKTEEFFHKNKKPIGIALLAVIVIIAGYFGYKNLYQTPRAKQAEAALFRAEHYFGLDSFQLALNGNGADVQGFLDVIKKYGNTKSGNLAQAYAGISYYKLGEPEKALEHLKKFKASDIMVAPTVIGLIGDCYVDLGKTQEAIKYFEDAAKRADNDLISPIYLIKAGIAYEALGKTDEALKAYNTVKDKYYNSPSYGDAEKYITAINLKKGAK